MDPISEVERRSLFTEEEIRSTIRRALGRGSAWKVRIVPHDRQDWKEASGMLVQAFPTNMGTIKVLVITGRGRVYATHEEVDDATVLESVIDTWPWSFLLEIRRSKGGWVLQGKGDQEDSI